MSGFDGNPWYSDTWYSGGCVDPNEKGCPDDERKVNQYKDYRGLIVDTNVSKNTDIVNVSSDVVPATQFPERLIADIFHKMFLILKRNAKPGLEIAAFIDNVILDMQGAGAGCLDFESIQNKLYPPLPQKQFDKELELTRAEGGNPKLYGNDHVFGLDLRHWAECVAAHNAECECHQSKGKNLEIPHATWCPKASK